MSSPIAIGLSCFLAATAGIAAPRAMTTADIVKSQIEIRQLIISNCNTKMCAIDARIESKIATLVTHLASVKDSSASGTQVVRTKREVIELLGSSIDFYRTERAKKIGQVHDPAQRQQTGDIVRTVANLNERIDERVEQIVTLSSSLMQHQDLAQYESARDGGYVHAGHIRDVGAKTEEVKREVKTQFDDAIDSLQREVETLENRLKDPAHAASRTTTEAWLANDRKLLARRQAQRDRALGAASKPESPVTSQAAQTIEEKIDETVADIREEYRNLMRLYNERDQARAELNSLAKKLPSPTPAKAAK